LNKLIEYRP